MAKRKRFKTKIALCCCVALLALSFLIANLTTKKDAQELSAPIGTVTLGDGTVAESYPNPNDYKDIDIALVLDTPAYTNLPEVAKDFIKESYEETGEIILTEQNKVENLPYLNPQYIQYLSLSESEQAEASILPTKMTVDYIIRETSESTNIPSNYDLRNVNGNNFTTPVKDQGDLGLCWTFSTAGITVSHLLVTNNSPYTLSSTLISERQIDYLTSKNGINDYDNEYVSFVNRSLGGGGNFYLATIALANGVSLVNYDDFKAYDDKDLSSIELSEAIRYDKSLYELNSTINFPLLNLRESTSTLSNANQQLREYFLNEVKQNIIDNGAAYVGTYMNSSCIYVDSGLNALVVDVYNCKYTGSHAMEIIGWDDNLTYSYCADTTTHQSNTTNCNNIVSGNGLWILKNSWGNNNPYLYLTYDSLYSNISFINEIQPSSSKNWDNNYILGDESENSISATLAFTNSKLRGEEKIKKVKFIVQNSNTIYSVKIKKSDGSYETFSKRSDLPGLITVDITGDVIVNQNSTIQIFSENNNGRFINKVSVFTSDTDNTPFIDLNSYNNVIMDTGVTIRLYSNTKHIPSGSTITYNLYDSNDQNITDKLTITNNIIAENNINTSATFSDSLTTATYKLTASYNSTVIGTTNIKIEKIEGTGTINDPYIITNASQLYNIRNNLGAHYELGNDIDLYDATHDGGQYSLASTDCSQSFGWEAIVGFYGSLDGKGHSIKGLYQNNYLTCNDDAQTTWNDSGNGFFASAYGDVTIKNLVLEDFDINCQGGACSALLSKYINEDNDPHTATFDNIVLKNSKISGVRNPSNSDSSKRQSYGGGLFGMIGSGYENINISNIYLDYELIYNAPDQELENPAYLFYELGGNSANVENILVKGELNEASEFGSTASVLGDIPYSDTNVTISNIISTVTAKNARGLFGNIVEASVNNVNMLSLPPTSLYAHNSNSTFQNVNVFEKTNLAGLTDKSNYSTWSNFDDGWTMVTVNNIPRLPVLKSVDFEYTAINNITIEHNPDHYPNIYDYITPNTAAAKRINFKSNDESIVTISTDGTIVPHLAGSTTIHVESYYDGYINDISVSVAPAPHYTIHFDANGGSGAMADIDVDIGDPYTLPKNQFTRENYKFKEWNTEPDGKGTSYAENQIINLSNVPNDTLKLYAIWVKNDPITIKKYTHDSNGNYITKISVGTTLDDYYANMVAGIGYTLDVETKNIDGQNIIYTGSRTRLKNGQTTIAEFTNVVPGDINGDGMINSADLLRMRQHLIAINPLTQAYYLAANITDNDQDINSADLLRIRQHLLNIKLIK